MYVSVILVTWLQYKPFLITCENIIWVLVLFVQVKFIISNKCMLLNAQLCALFFDLILILL